MSYALMLGILIQRSGLTIVVLMLSHMLEAIIKANVDNFAEWSVDFFPMQSITNLVPLPFARYALQEIQDFVAWQAVLIVMVWIFLFNYFSYWRLKKADI